MGYKKWLWAQLYEVLGGVAGLDGISAGRIATDAVKAVETVVDAQPAPRAGEGEVAVIGADGTPWTVEDILRREG